MKCVLDSIAAGGLYADDSQVKHIDASMHDPLPGGKVIVRLSDYGRPPAAAFVSSN